MFSNVVSGPEPCTFISSYECSPFMYEYIHLLVYIKQESLGYICGASSQDTTATLEYSCISDCLCKEPKGKSGPNP
jgi:hypothetical protein